MPHPSHERQGSQGWVLGWILRNRKRQQQRWRAGEVATTMASLPAKIYRGCPECFISGLSGEATFFGLFFAKQSWLIHQN